MIFRVVTGQRKDFSSEMPQETEFKVQKLHGADALPIFSI
jgi:hypothetical protein